MNTEQEHPHIELLHYYASKPHGAFFHRIGWDKLPSWLIVKICQFADTYREHDGSFPQLFLFQEDGCYRLELTNRYGDRVSRLVWKEVEQIPTPNYYFFKEEEETTNA